MWWPFRRRRAPAPDARADALRAFLAGGPPSAEQAHDLLDLWAFDPPEPVTLFFVRAANIRRHKMLPQADWGIVLEDGEVLTDGKVMRIADTLAKLAPLLGIAL